MKKLTMKRLYKLGSFLGIVGLLVLIGAKANNFLQNPQYQDDKVVFAKKSRSQNKVNKSFNVKDFDQVKLNTNRPDIKFVVGKTFSVQANGTNRAHIELTRVSVKNRKLTIYDKPTGHHNYGGYTVTITVPNKNSIKKVTGNCDISDIYFKGLNIPSIAVKTGYGDVIFNHVNSENVSVKQTNGDLKVLNSTIKNSTVKLSVGDLTIKNSKFKTKANLALAPDFKYSSVKIQNSSLLGNSSINLAIGDFVMTGAPKISYDLTTKPKGKIKFQSRHYTHQFSKTAPNQPILKVNSRGNIKID